LAHALIETVDVRLATHAAHIFGSQRASTKAFIEAFHFRTSSRLFPVSGTTLIEALHVLAATLGSSHRLLDSTAFLEFDFTSHVVSSLRERCWS
jgi:hypothetical protein